MDFYDRWAGITQILQAVLNPSPLPIICQLWRKEWNWWSVMISSTERPPPAVEPSWTAHMQDRLGGLVVRRPSLVWQTWVRSPPSPRRFFQGWVKPVTSMAYHWFPCQGPGNRGSGLGLVGLLSACCNRVRLQMLSATYNCLSNSIPEIH